MHPTESEEWKIDRLLHELNIHLQDIPLDENEAADFAVSNDLELQKLIDGLNERLPREEAGT